MKIFDTHAHYDDEKYDEDREDLIKEMNENGVVAIVNCGASFKGLKDSLTLSEKYEEVYAAIGIHPENADEYDEYVENFIEENVKNKKVVAIGEIGLDYYWSENPSKEVQMQTLKKQYNLARKFSLPTILHVRDAYEDMLPFLNENNDVKAVLHAFSGSAEIARQMVDKGYYFGIGGVVTFKNSRVLKEALEVIPMERILVETDAPYMTSEPNRGKRNRSDYIENVIRKIAEVKGIDEKECEEIVFNNALSFFNLNI